MAKKWDRYTNARQSQTGRMICCTCGKPITEGPYRYRETEHAFVNQHRHCAPPDDPAWAEIEAEQKARAEREREFASDVAALRKKWPGRCFDDYDPAQSEATP